MLTFSVKNLRDMYVKKKDEKRLLTFACGPVFGSHRLEYRCIAVNWSKFSKRVLFCSPFVLAPVTFSWIHRHGTKLNPYKHPANTANSMPLNGERTQRKIRPKYRRYSLDYWVLCYFLVCNNIVRQIKFH